MHSQRCPMAKYLAATQQNKGMTGQSPNCVGPVADGHLQKRKQGMSIKSIISSKEKCLLPSRFQTPKGQEKTSFFQKLHGDAAPLLPPRPQMYSDDNWVQPCKPEKASSVYQKDKNTTRKPCDHPLAFNQSCTIHGLQSRRGSRHYVFPKSISCPTPAVDSRQTANAERLKNWRRNSLTITDVAATGHRPQNHYNAPCTSLSSFSSANPSSMSLAKNVIPDDLQTRRSQFRRAFTFFSIGCDELEKEKRPPQQRILRQPTRHVYRRGISGLPIDCTNRSMGVAF